MSNPITEALAKFAEAIKALKDVGIITSADQISVQPQDAPVAPQSEAAVEAAVDAASAAVETAPVTTATPVVPKRGSGGRFLKRGESTAVESTAATAAPVVPQRGAGGRFLKRDGSQGTSKKIAKAIAKAVSKRVIAPGLVDDFVAWFFKTPQEGLYNVKCGQYECRLGDVAQKTAHTLIFHSSAATDTWNGTIRIKSKVTPKDANNIIGIRPIDSKIGVFNASRLLYGNHNAAQLRPQAAAEKAGAVPIPFQNVVARSGGAGLDLSKLEIVEWRGTERLIIPPVARGRQWVGDFYVIQRHFAGAMVVRVEDKYFLFDADREELNNFGFNPFFTQLPGPASTVAEAYELLMPESVKQALKEGRDVKRQGEFFFIPLTHNEIMAYVVGDTVDPVSDHKTVYSFMDVERRLNDVGAAHFNWLQHGRLCEVNDFIERCNEHTAGSLPETPVDSTPMLLPPLADLFKPLTEQLAQRVGTPLAQGMLGDVDLLDKLAVADRAKRKNNPYFRAMMSTISSPTYTHLSFVASDLERECRITTERTDTTTITPVGIYAQRFGIMFNIRIGETPSANDWRQRQHRATAVMQSKYTKGDVLAIGAVVHEGREHAPLYLPCWHRIVSNTATNNWSVSGDVD